MNAEEFVAKYYQGFGDTGGKASLDSRRSVSLIQALSMTLQTGGDVAECGVWKGGTAWLIAKYLQLYAPDKTLYLFDSFQGMPETSPIDGHKRGDFADTSVDSVMDYLKEFNNVCFIAGFFPESFKRMPDEFFACGDSFSFVHADMDLYQSTKDIWLAFRGYLTNGSIICFDDYHAPGAAGVKKAIDELQLYTEDFGHEMRIYRR